ncbi:MAG: hypothetical protein AB7F75_05140, partial [Planctomycetota bacterium]
MIADIFGGRLLGGFFDSGRETATNVEGFAVYVPNDTPINSLEDVTRSKATVSLRASTVDAYVAGVCAENDSDASGSADIAIGNPDKPQIYGDDLISAFARFVSELIGHPITIKEIRERGKLLMFEYNRIESATIDARASGNDDTEIRFRTRRVRETVEYSQYFYRTFFDHGGFDWERALINRSLNDLQAIVVRAYGALHIGSAETLTLQAGLRSGFPILQYISRAIDAAKKSTSISEFLLSNNASDSEQFSRVGIRDQLRMLFTTPVREIMQWENDKDSVFGREYIQEFSVILPFKITPTYKPNFLGWWNIWASGSTRTDVEYTRRK